MTLGLSIPVASAPTRNDPSLPAGDCPAAQTLRRGLSILRLLARSQSGELRLSDISRRLEMSKPTAVRLIHALVEEGFIVRNPENALYRLGPESCAIGLAAEPSYAIQRTVVPLTQSLARKTGDCTCFSVRQGFEVVCLSVERGYAPVPPSALRIGDRYPLGITSAGLAVLASLCDDEVEQALATHGKYIARAYPRSPVEVIRQRVAEARKNGYAFVPGLLVPGCWALGVPLVDAAHRTVGAISVVSTESRLGPTRRTVLGEQLRGLASNLMATFGAEPVAQASLSRRRSGISQEPDRPSAA